ncbi:MAG: RsmB/NOP family class I SAM-dependent RNA methyltransferase [Acidobacteria bacterium]|nr:RsmB/NOP family class I SAM-dependent RNA methyltransferase [Acidobacteriota bacterium]
MNEIAQEESLPFARYRPLIDDPRPFDEALGRPLPICVWANPSRTTPDALEAFMNEEGLAFEPLAWHPGSYRLPEGVSQGNRIEYLTGLYYVQEEVSLLPVHLLDPQPGERVLDLCAAPGNKTAQIGLRLGREGTVVANDVSLDRVSILRRNLGRFGVTNCVTTIQDATGYPPASGVFDRVLADVPCSCEGTTRRSSEPFERARRSRPGRLSGLQASILRKAVQLCRPGGRIVYSTCTFAPEENEAVVDEVLRSTPPGVLRLLPTRVPGFASSPGITQWQGRRYSPELEGALRAWPHQNDTGGFFVAVLEKVGAQGNEPTAEALPLEPIPSQGIFEELGHWYGLPSATFRGLAVLEPNKRCLALGSASAKLPARPKAHAAGLPFLYFGMTQPKLTTAAALLLGAEARRGFVELDRRQTDLFLHRGHQDLPRRQIEACDAGGPVIARYRGVALGLGFLRLSPGKAPRLESLYPKGWALLPGRSAFDGTNPRA